LIENPRVAGQNQGLVRFAEQIFGWIPASAGMTDLLRYFISRYFSANYRERTTNITRTNNKNQQVNRGATICHIPSQKKFSYIRSA
jgi:hypothetical protein